MSKEDIFGTPMKVREAIALLSYGANFELKGAYSGKIYHRSWNNKKKNIEKYLDKTTVDNPYYTKLVADKEGDYCRPIIGIWMHDYEICKEKGLGNE